MADAILSDIAGRLIEQLGSWVFKEIGLACKVGDEIKKLEVTMCSIKAVLLDAEERHGKKNHQVTEWLLRLKEAVYDADDLLDDFATEIQLRQEEVCICFSNYNPLAYSLKMAHKIKTIRKRLYAINRDRKFGLDVKPIENTTRQTHSFVRADHVIGRDEDKNIIIQRLLDTNDVDSLSVIPIVGIGGLGKTTLAQYVYNDENVKNNFQLRMWVCVSDVFDERRIVRDIIKNIEKSSNDMNVESLEKLNADELIEHLHRLIDGKKYLLVLDDIWDENRDKWLNLKMLLMNDIKGSKILITTRSKRVAEITSVLPCHVLKGLNEDQSWSLFTQMAFEGGIEPKGSNLVNIGKCIVKKCHGVPLAIRTIGRFLYYKDENYWSGFKENGVSQIGSQEAGDILPTLKLSYDNLPSHLKQCFAYCALFPKDYEIKKDYLVDLWMAQGFIQSSNMNYSLEAIGNEYFMNLLSRSFFQDVEYDEWGDVINCKMHDLMHDLATQVAGSECALLKSGATGYQAKTRHISFDYELDFSCELPSALFEKTHLRTFLMPLRRRNNILNESSFYKILSSFTCLRTLNLNGSNVKKLPNSISKLKHLRYLDMSYNKEIEELPNSMSKLKNLQILKLTCCGSLTNLPRDIRKMVSLRCLMIEGCNSLFGIPRGLRLLTNLRMLSTFVLGSEGKKYAELDELNGLKNLSGSLEIRGLETINSKHSLLANLKAKKNLVDLKLYWRSKDGLLGDPLHDEVLECLQPHPNLKCLKIRGFMSMRISSWVSSLTNLTEIEIVDCKRCQHIPRLDQLPSLKSLRLESLNDLEYMISEKDSNDSSSTSLASFFPSLGILSIWYCPNLKGWWRDVGDDDGAMDLPSFPCLSQLDITSCPNLSCLPLCPSVEELTFRNASLRPLEQTMKLKNIAAVPSTSSTVSAPFSKLNSLSIEGCQDLDFLTNVDDKQWKGFTSLNSISLWEISELVSLPQGLQHVPNLQELWIIQCPKLMDLPEGMMQLQVLGIEQCPQLKERCGNNEDVDWPKISHIPNIRIDYWWIQKDGCYQLNTEEAPLPQQLRKASYDGETETLFQRRYQGSQCFA